MNTKNSPVGQKRDESIIVNWEKENWAFGPRYRFSLNGRNSEIWIDKDKYFISSIKYQVYCSGRNHAKRLGMFNKLTEAKDFAVSRQMERNQAEKDRLNSIIETVTEYVNANDYYEFSKVYSAIPENMRKRIHTYLVNPTTVNWDDVSSIDIRPSIGLTIWQAVILTTPGFPRQGRAYNDNGKVIREWTSIPSKEEFVNAIRYAVFFTSELKLQEEMYQVY